MRLIVEVDNFLQRLVITGRANLEMTSLADSRCMLGNAPRPVRGSAVDRIPSWAGCTPRALRRPSFLSRTLWSDPDQNHQNSVDSFTAV